MYRVRVWDGGMGRGSVDDGDGERVIDGIDGRREELGGAARHQTEMSGQAHFDFHFCFPLLLSTLDLSLLATRWRWGDWDWKWKWKWHLGLRLPLPRHRHRHLGFARPCLPLPACLRLLLFCCSAVLLLLPAADFALGRETATLQRCNGKEGLDGGVAEKG